MGRIGVAKRMRIVGSTLSLKEVPCKGSPQPFGSNPDYSGKSAPILLNQAWSGGYKTDIFPATN